MSGTLCSNGAHGPAWVRPRILTFSCLFKLEVCLAFSSDPVVCVPKKKLFCYWPGYIWFFSLDLICLVCLLLICAVDPRLDFWLCLLTLLQTPACPQPQTRSWSCTYLPGCCWTQLVTWLHTATGWIPAITSSSLLLQRPRTCTLVLP